MKKFSAVLFVIILGACAYKHEPIYNVEKPMPAGIARLPMDRIETIVVEAGQVHNWKLERVEIGHLFATQSDQKHSAGVDIYFNQNGWRIVHRSSSGMNEQGGAIHSHYNLWIRNLEKDIDTRLTNAALVVK